MAFKTDQAREFSHRSRRVIAVLGYCLAIGATGVGAEDTAIGDDTDQQFDLWAMSDPHVFSDLFLRMKELKRLNPEVSEGVRPLFVYE